jgi:hypothetical protein
MIQKRGLGIFEVQENRKRWTAYEHAESFLRVEELEIRDQFDGWMMNLKQ